ncbi:MAG: HTH-type transcriptional repressor NicS [Pseudomonadota bacterium]
MVNYLGMSVQKSLPTTKTRDAERSRAVILNAALEEFALFGLGGARIDRIAERSNLNKRLIYYYFTDKDRLFQAVLESAYEQIRESEKKLNLQSLQPATAIRTLVEFTWNYYLEHPEFLTLLNSANLHKARHIQESSNVRALNSPLIELLGEILEKGRLAGEFRGGIDPVQLYVSIAGLSYFYLSNNSSLSAIFGRDLMSPRAKSERLSHMCEVILGYVLRS